jgi:hypothetical protein
MEHDMTHNEGRRQLRGSTLRRLGLGLLALAGCQSQESPDRPLVLTRDSANVHIVEHSVGALDHVPKWALSSPIGSIGEQGTADYDLYQVRGAVFVSDDEIVVANGGDAELRTYSSDGQYVRTRGGRGGGPGEFGSLGWVGIAPDSSVIAWDASAGRFTFLADENRALRELPVEDMSTPLPGRPRLVGMLSDGSIVMKSSVSDMQHRETPEGEIRDSITFEFFDSAGHPENASIRSRGTEKYLFRSKQAQMWGSQPIIFGRDTHAVVARDRLIVGTNDSFELRAYDSTGHLRQIVRVESDPEPVTERDAARVRAELVASLRPASGLPESLRLGLFHFDSLGIERVPFRSVMPPFTGLVSDQMGRVWVEMSARPDAETRSWLAVDPAGNLVGSVELPRGAQIIAATRRRLAVLSTDALGTESIQIYHYGAAERPEGGIDS